jgi:hypothetical protein
MRVVSVLTAQWRVRYAVVDDGGDRVDVIGAYLQHLDDRGYARNILKAYAQGVCLFFRFLAEARGDYRTVGNAERVIGANELELAYVRSNLDATRTDKGYCFKPRKMACPYVDLPCYTCRNWATTPAFLPEFGAMERDLRFQIELGE